MSMHSEMQSSERQLSGLEQNLPVESPRTADWVPDSEVHKCPLCSKKFGTTFRKHHCRACGRVFCANCSSNQIDLPNHSSKQRVCDTCFDVRRHDKNALLSKNLDDNRRVEASLKADLREAHQQVEWFKSFVLKVGAEAVDVASGEADIDAGIASDGIAVATAASDGNDVDAASSPISSPRGANATSAFDSLSADLRPLVIRARQRWKDECSKLAMKSTEVAQIQQDCESLDRELQERSAGVREFRKAIRGMDAKLRNRPQIEAQRDQLSLKAGSLKDELEGLTQRMAALEMQQPRTGTSFSSGNSRSFGNSQNNSFGILPARDAHVARCRERCVVL